jgi:hydroxymethylbilane synthase
MNNQIRIGTRESQLAVWQANHVKDLLAANQVNTVLVPIQSEGDIDLISPLYEMGVQGIFTKTLDIALLEKKVDIAVHSMKDVPTKLPKGLVQAAVLKRASYDDVLVYKNNADFLNDSNATAVIATSSIRRKAQWQFRYPNHRFENLRGNVNSRLRKLEDNNWNGAIFAAAGLERINLLPSNAIRLDWMLPAPAQGAIMVVCREDDHPVREMLAALNHSETEICTKAERDFLRKLMGGCSTPISALAEIRNDEITFRGNILSLNGDQKKEIELTAKIADRDTLETIGTRAAEELLESGGKEILANFSNATG